jgi:hypothetical protein
MKIIRPVSAVLSLLLLSALQVACASSNCVFDKDYFNKARYTDNNSIQYVAWEDTSKTAKIITAQGELVSVKHWSCNHLGIHAVMLIGPYSEDDSSDLNKYFKKLAAIALDKQEADLVNSYLGGHKISLEPGTQTFRLDNNEYSEFYLMLTVVNEAVVIEIKFYRN